MSSTAWPPAGGSPGARQFYGMAVIESRADESSAEFRANRAHFIGLLAQLRDRSELVAAGGGADAMARHTARGKLPARDRIGRLVDPETPFLEFSALAAWEMYDGDAPC